MRLDIDVYGDKQFSRELLRIRDRADNMAPAFEAIADDFLEIERRQFASEGAFASGGWRPLAPSTVRFKAAMGYDPRILHRTLRLRESLTNKNHPEHVRRITADELEVGTSVTNPKGFPYPAAHQNPQQGQIRRRVIELPYNVRRRWIKILQRHVLGGGVR